MIFHDYKNSQACYIHNQLYQVALILVPPYIFLPTICCHSNLKSFFFVLSLLQNFMVPLRCYISSSFNQLFELLISEHSDNIQVGVYNTCLNTLLFIILLLICLLAGKLIESQSMNFGWIEGEEIFFLSYTFLPGQLGLSNSMTP